MKRFLLPLICLFFKVFIGAQNQQLPFPNVQAMTPEAAAISAYEDIPVSNYTGVPEISIPLYEIDVDGFKLPITLSYHASGIRVSQEATCVGLGWTLNAGGRIVRQVNCTDDFYERGGDSYHPWIRKGYYDSPAFSTANTDSLYEYYGYAIPPLTIGGVGYHLIADPEPDVFSYSLPGLSGKFIFDNNKNAILFDRSQNLRIEVIRSSNPTYVRLKMTDGEGNQYFFEDEETTKNYLTDGPLNRNIITPNTKYDDNENTYITWDYFEPLSDGDDGMEAGPVNPYEMTTAWCLTRIVTAKGRQVSFNYEPEYQQLPTQESSEIYNSDIYPRSQFFYRSKIINNALRLSSIVWDMGRIDFSASARNDIKGNAKKMDSITIKNVNGNVIKQYSLGYSYFNDDNDDGRYGQYEHVFKRLKLTGVNELSFSPSQGYTFDYYEGSMPAKNSRNTDYWGFQNGQAYGKDYCVGVNVNGHVYPGVTKDAVFNHTIIGTLRQINYPTGGPVRFTYESHNYGGGIGVSVNNEAGTGTPTSGTSYQLAVCNNYIANEHPELPETDTLRFSITSNSNVHFTVDYHLENHNCGYKDPDYGYCGDILLALYRISENGNRTIIYSSDCPYLFERSGTGGVSIIGIGCEDEGSLGRSLSVGIYEFVACRPPKDVSAEWNITFDHIVDFNMANANNPTLALTSSTSGAGIRIAKIETNATTRTFRYPLGDRLIAPVFYYLGKRAGYATSDAPALIQASDSKTPLMTFGRGNFVGYDWVEERLEAYHDTTCVRYYFMNSPETEQYDDSFPDCPVAINYTNGLLTKKQYYKNNTLLKEENFTYSATTNPRIYVLRDKSEKRLSDYMYFYYYDIEWPLTVSASEHIHEANGMCSKQAIFSYNNHDLLQSVSQSVDGNVFSTHLKYPFDQTDPVSSTMVEKNMVSLPVEQINSVDGSIISGEKITYTSSGQNILPYEKFQLDATIPQSAGLYDSSYARKMRINAYTSYGNPQEIYFNNEVVSYIWSYKGFYPVAVVRNARWQDIISLLGATQLATFHAKIPTDTEINAFLAPLRQEAASMGWLVTSYTHKPLFGVTSITEPSGMTTYFEYDNSGRLVNTKDADLHLLKQYQYHYRP